MAFYNALILIILILLGTSCSPRYESHQSVSSPEEEEIGLDAVITKEVTPEGESIPSREAVFLYKDSERPLMTYEGGPKVTGIIGGEEPMVIVELVGQGFVVKAGDKICGYRVKTINSEAVVLTKAGRSYSFKLE